jgi:hypothetical protein
VSLRQIDGKRITDEERRNAKKAIRREEDKRQDSQRNQVATESRKRIVDHIKARWYDVNKTARNADSELPDFLLELIDARLTM